MEDTHYKMLYAKYLSLSSNGFLKEVFFKDFTIYIKGKTMTPGAGPILTPGLLIDEQRAITPK
jgi:hypothetical protein